MTLFSLTFEKKTHGRTEITMNSSKRAPPPPPLQIGGPVRSFTSPTSATSRSSDKVSVPNSAVAIRALSPKKTTRPCGLTRYHRLPGPSPATTLHGQTSATTTASCPTLPAAPARRGSRRRLRRLPRRLTSTSTPHAADTPTSGSSADGPTRSRSTERMKEKKS